MAESDRVVVADTSKDPTPKLPGIGGPDRLPPLADPGAFDRIMAVRSADAGKQAGGPSKSAQAYAATLTWLASRLSHTHKKLKDAFDKAQPDDKAADKAAIAGPGAVNDARMVLPELVESLDAIADEIASAATEIQRSNAPDQTWKTTALPMLRYECHTMSSLVDDIQKSKLIGPAFDPTKMTKAYDAFLLATGSADVTNTAADFSEHTLDLAISATITMAHEDIATMPGDEKLRAKQRVKTYGTLFELRHLVVAMGHGTKAKYEAEVKVLGAELAKAMAAHPDLGQELAIQLGGIQSALK